MPRNAPMLVRLLPSGHTLSALPLALTAAFAASLGWPSAWALSWILAAMIAAHAAATAAGRLAAPARVHPNRRASALATWLLFLGAAAVFALASAMLNRLCLILSPLALALILGCPYAKRFTVLGHWVLGLCLGLAPLGAWLAVRAGFALAPIILAAAAAFWAAGFHIIHTCGEIPFYRAHRLLSLPARWGARRALLVAALNHVIAIWLLVLFGQVADLSWIYLLGVIVLMPVLFWAHRRVRPEDLSRAGAVSSLVNGLASLILFLFAAFDVILISSRIRI